MSIRDKAKNLDFSALPQLGSTPAKTDSAPGDPVIRPKTAPGAMMAFANDQRSELLKENERLHQQAEAATGLRTKLEEANHDLRQWDGAKAGRLLDPVKIRRSRWANRHEASFLSEAFKALKQEIANAGGNVQPIKVRRINDGSFEHEIIFGHRRHQACLELGLPILALVDNVSDTDLFVEMDRENRARQDLSPYELGVMYRRALREGLFPSNRKLAEAVGADISALGKALWLADLPASVLEAFPSPLDLQFRWAKPLADAVNADREAVLERAVALKTAATKLAAKAVFERLVESPTHDAEVSQPTSSVSIQVRGVRTGTVRMDGKGRAVVQIDAAAITPDRLAALAKAVEAFLSEKKPKR